MPKRYYRALFMKPLDVIIAAGLLMDRELDLEAIVNNHCNPRSVKVITPATLSKRTLRESIVEIVERAATEIVARINELRAEFGDEIEVTLMGRSFGGLVVLLAAIKLEFRNIRLTIPFEAPLHPEVPVVAPRMVPPLWLCRKHYSLRPTLAKEAQLELEKLGTGKVMIIKGGSPDQIVPEDAQGFPGDFRSMELSTDAPLPDFGMQSADNGLIVTLPAYPGKEVPGALGLLPQDYRTHLFWPDDKKLLVGGVLNRALTGATTSQELAS